MTMIFRRSVVLHRSVVPACRHRARESPCGLACSLPLGGKRRPKRGGANHRSERYIRPARGLFFIHGHFFARGPHLVRPLQFFSCRVAVARAERDEDCDRSYVHSSNNNTVLRLRLVVSIFPLAAELCRLAGLLGEKSLGRGVTPV